MRKICGNPWSDYDDAINEPLVKLPQAVTLMPDYRHPPAQVLLITPADVVRLLGHQSAPCEFVKSLRFPASLVLNKIIR